MRRRAHLCAALSLVGALFSCAWGTGCSGGFGIELESTCQTDEDCPEGYECAGLIFTSCAPGCARLKCEQGTVCVRDSFGGGTCKPGCANNDDCPAHSFCARPCSGLLCPDAGLFAPGPAPQCEPGCHDDGECGTREVCEEGKCMPHCSDDAECDARETCREGTCVQPCSDNADCEGASVCATGLATLLTAEPDAACTSGTECTCFACSGFLASLPACAPRRDSGGETDAQPNDGAAPEGGGTDGG